MPSKYYKTIGILLTLLILSTVLVGCDIFQENETQTKQVYLNLAASNSYGIQNLEPGQGRYIYDKGSVADIEFEYNEGYKFLGWEGKDGKDITKEKDGQYILQMNEDKEIKAELKLVDFQPIEIDFDGIDPFNYPPQNQVTNVPHNLENVAVTFNNKLNQENELSIAIESENETDNIEAEQIEITENKINISLTDWRDRFYSDNEEDDYLKFGNEYTLNVGTNNNNNIFDVNNKEIDSDIVINFKVEEPYPEKPKNVNIEINDNNVELSWIRSKTNAKIDVEDYVQEYIIYRSKNEDHLEDEESLSNNNVKVINISVDNPQGQKIIRYTDKNLDLSNDQYYYRVKAVNNYDNESKLSSLVSTN